jgi:hypothetical protein
MMIIDNKKIDLTGDEYALYDKICRSYDRPNCKGEELFKGLFETDDNGIITFIVPPSIRQTSMEIYLFVSSIYQHQHMRILYNKFDALEKKLNDKMIELEKKAEKKK